MNKLLWICAVAALMIAAPAHAVGLRAVIDQARQEAKIQREVPLGEVSDIALLREAQKELGVKAR